MMILTLLPLAAAAAAPSFDCARARSRIEHAICDSAELAELDREEARLYRIALAAPQARRGDLIERQRAFLSDRAGCAEPATPLDACLRDAYLGDISDLRRIAGLADENRGLSFGPNRFACDGGYPDIYVTVFLTEPEQGYISIPKLNEGQPLVAADPAAPDRLRGRYATDMLYDIDKKTVRIGQRICTLAD